MKSNLYFRWADKNVDVFESASFICPISREHTLEAQDLGYKDIFDAVSKKAIFLNQPTEFMEIRKGHKGYGLYYKDAISCCPTIRDLDFVVNEWASCWGINSDSAAIFVLEGEKIHEIRGEWIPMNECIIKPSKIVEILDPNFELALLKYGKCL